MPKIVPAMHRILCELINADKEPEIYKLKETKIIIPDSATPHETRFSRIYRILAVSEGEEINSRNKVGDLLFLMPLPISKVTWNEFEYLLITEAEILGRLEPLPTDEIVASVN